MTSGAFHSTKTFENLGTAANGTENIQTLLNFRNVNHSTENSRNPGSKVKWKEKIGVYLEKVVLFFWKFWKILFHSLLKVVENSNRTFWLNGNAQGKLEGPFAGRTNVTFQPHLCEKKRKKFPKVL